MSSNLNWAQPIYGADVQTSQAYLQRLQEFLAAQSGGSGDNQVNGSNAIAGSSESNKRKNPGDNASTSTASKDRRQSGGRASADGTHTHVDQADRDDRSESPEQTSTTKKKGSTTSDKRKEQNRNAQRAFRERKEKVLKDLEEKIEGLNKVNDQQSSENKNLRELVDRLQQENARLQQAHNSQPPAPQSDFTFRSQPAPLSNSSSAAVPYQSGSATSDGPASLTDQDILAFLNQPAPVFPQQSAYTMIQPSAQGSQLGSGSSEDWLWNASTFGTEIPQAIPLDVTNLADSSRSPNNNAIFPWADLSANTGSTGNFSASGPTSSNANYAPYLTGFPSFHTNNAASQSVSQSASQQGHSSRSASQTHTSASRSSSDGTSGKAGSRNGGTAAESPETTCSSSGSDPSDALPATPSSAPFPYVSNGQDGQIDFAAMFGQSQSGFGDLKASPYSFLTSPGLQGSGMVKTETPPTSFFGSMQATTPSAIFDSLNYRDPLLADLDDNGNRSTDLLANLDNKNENFDLSDFLVASPPSQQGASAGPSPPAFLHHSSSGSTQSGYASSSGSVPTMGNQAYPRSTSSGQSSSAASPQANVQGQVTLPYNMTYGHPLASYVLQSMQGKSPSSPPQQLEATRQPWQQYADQIMQGCKQKAFEDEVQKRQAKGGVMDAHDLDSLCKDMQVKATCQEMIRKKVQDSMDSDQEMMELYKKYMQDGQKA